MSQREKILAALVGGLVLLMAGNWGLERYRSKLGQNRSRQFSAEQRLSSATAEQARGLRAKRMLHGWRQQSLPSNKNIAKSLYQDWLQSQLTSSGMKVKQLQDRSSSQVKNKNYQQISFTANANGTLSQLVVFLHQFYQSNHLHRISNARLVPDEGRKNLDVLLTVDALLLPDTDRTDTLATGSSELLADLAEDYQQRIDSRNVFQIYSPTQSEPEVEVAETDDPGEDKEANQAKVTAMTLGQHGWRMAIRMEKSGKVQFFREGDEIQIGSIAGKIVVLDGRRVIIETADQRLLVSLGQTLGQAKSLSDQAG